MRSRAQANLGWWVTALALTCGSAAALVAVHAERRAIEPEVPAWHADDGWRIQRPSFPQESQVEGTSDDGSPSLSPDGSPERKRGIRPPWREPLVPEQRHAPGRRVKSFHA